MWAVKHLYHQTVGSNNRLHYNVWPGAMRIRQTLELIGRNPMRAFTKDSKRHNFLQLFKLLSVYLLKAECGGDVRTSSSRWMKTLEHLLSFLRRLRHHLFTVTYTIVWKNTPLWLADRCAIILFNAHIVQLKFKLKRRPWAGTALHRGLERLQQHHKSG